MRKKQTSTFSDLLLCHLLLFLSTSSCVRPISLPQEILTGFSATPEPSTPPFQPLLADPTSVFALGFLRLDFSRLTLAVLHLPSSQPIWRAAFLPTNSPRWAAATHLSFNGSLLLSDSHSRPLWATPNTRAGNRLRLLNTSNLQIMDAGAVVWQSFDFPYDTLVENQNFTSQMTLRSSNGLYSMRATPGYLGLYSDFGGGTAQLYWKRTPLETKAQIEEGQGSIYARVEPDGFLGLYQTEKAPLDVLAFATYHRGVYGFRRLRLESDGNLRAEFWNSTAWVLDFEAIQETCNLPLACGGYGLCRPGKGCSCLDNRTEFSASGDCSAPQSGDFCSNEGGRFWVIRRTGVDVPNKELMGFEKVGSAEECEDSCLRNCSCWGAVFGNVSGFCYRISYPIQTMVGVGDESKVGFFKVRSGGEGKGEVGVGMVLLLSVGVAVVGVVVGFGVWFWRWKRRLERDGLGGEDGISPGPYRDLKQMLWTASFRTDSFKSVELCRR
ncbi:hypothetical protein ACLOJK_020754 [Asimina triloba]